MKGLAESMAGNTQTDPVEKIIELLLGGVTPEELVEKGVPTELIMQAIEILEQQVMAQNSGQQMQPQAPQGLAQAMVG